MKNLILFIIASLSAIILFLSPARSQDIKSSFVKDIGQRLHVLSLGGEDQFLTDLMSYDDEGYIDDLATPKSLLDAHLTFIFINGRSDFLNLTEYEELKFLEDDLFSTWGNNPIKVYFLEKRGEPTRPAKIVFINKGMTGSLKIGKPTKRCLIRFFYTSGVYNPEDDGFETSNGCR